MSERGEAFEKFPAHRVDTTFSLNGLEEEGDRFVGEGGLDCIEVVWLDVCETAWEGIEAFVDLGLSGRGHGSDCPTVEGFVEGDDIVATGGLPESPREFDETIICFRPGV